jgi:DNA polymerase III alpha subunit
LAAAWHREAKSSHASDRPLSLAELLAGESRALGFCATAHPLTPMVEWAADKGLVNACDLAPRAGTTARVWGQVIAYKRIPTRKTKESMAFATLEDPTGLSELVFFPRAYRACGELLTCGKPLVVEGAVKDDRGGLTLIVERAWAVRGVTVRRPVEVPDEASSEGIA